MISEMVILDQNVTTITRSVKNLTSSKMMQQTPQHIQFTIFNYRFLSSLWQSFCSISFILSTDVLKCADLGNVVGVTVMVYGSVR